MGNLGSALGGATSGGGLASAQRAQTTSSEANQAQQIGAQMQSEQQKTAAQIRQIREETRTKVAEMFRDTTLNRAKSSTKIHGKWVQQVMA